MTAFQAYLENGRRTDNGSVTRALASLIANAHRTTGDTTLVAISGAAGLGKTTLAKELVAALAELSPRSKVGVLPTDAFMLSREERAVRSLSGYDPRASSVDQLSRTVRDAGQRQPVAYRGYDHRTGQHAVEPTTLGPCDVVLVEGIHSFHPLISHLTRIKLFLYAAPADAKEMRFLTDLFERNYNVHLAFQHAQQEYGEFEAHVLHYARLADRVVQVDSYWNYSLVD
jgi:uridine kinase